MLSLLTKVTPCDEYSFFYYSQDTQSLHQQSVGGSYDNSRFQNNDQGTNDNNYVGGYSRGGVPPAKQQQPQSSTQVYRPPHMQNRMSVPK